MALLTYLYITKELIVITLDSLSLITGLLCDYAASQAASLHKEPLLWSLEDFFVYC